jgi:hypothetical protein
MDITQYKWQQTGEHGNFVYALNGRGTNAFCFNVQGANDTELERAVATLACAAPLLLEALKGLIAVTKESRGVAGYHLNGQIADWDEFDFYFKAVDAIAAAEGE